MRFSGMILFCLVVISLLSATILDFINVNKVRLLALEFNQKADAEYFISESFRKTCRGEGFDSLNEWQIVCKALWQLEYIGWGNAEDFMIVDYSFNECPLIYGKWQGRIMEGEVFCRKE